jgi:alpha-ribazole phosphatase
MTVGPTEWWLVRHAPTINPDKAVYGELDLDIQMPSAETFRALSDTLPDSPVWMVSHLSRTSKTLEGILAARGHGDAEYNIEERFGEQNFGDWEGRPSKDVWAEIRENDKSWPADIRPPGGETFSEVAARVHEAALDWSKKLAGQSVVAVIHAGSIRGFLSAAMGGPPVQALSYSVETLSITRCDYIDSENWRVNFVNRLAG